MRLSDPCEIRNFKAALLQKMYRLQDEINHLYKNFDANREEVAQREREISKLFSKLRRVQDHEKDQLRPQ